MLCAPHIFTKRGAKHRLWYARKYVVTFGDMFAIATLMTLISQVSGTPYIPGGDSPAGTDCSGLASWVSNAATGRPVYGSRFHTGNEEAALLARGFHYGTAPNSLVIGWNRSHTAVTLPDGTAVSSGEGGGVRVGGGGAYQPQFTHHMYLPMPAEEMTDPLAPPPPDAPPLDVPPPDAPPPADQLPPPPAGDIVPADAQMAPPPVDPIPQPA
jgi:hypothetical protein